MVTNSKVVVVWILTTCSLGSGHQIFGGICCLHLQDKSDFGHEFGSSMLVSNHNSTSLYVTSRCDTQLKRGIGAVHNSYTLQ
jgi:hypothetical protein